MSNSEPDQSNIDPARPAEAAERDVEGAHEKAAAAASPDSAASTESKEFGPFVRILIDKFPLIKYVLAGLGVTSALLAAIDKLTTNAEQIRHHVYVLIGLEGMRALHFWLGIAVFVLLVCIYVACSVWISVLHVRKKKSRVRFAFGHIALILSFGLLSIFSVRAAVADSTDEKAIYDKVSEEWRDTLLDTQNTDGGMRWMKVDSSAESQAWATAQILVAVLDSTSKLGFRDVTRVRSALAYFETVRLKSVSMDHDPESCSIPPEAQQSGGKIDGWGYFPRIPWAVTEINAWVTLANAKALHHPEIVQDVTETRQRVKRYADILAADELPQGGWSPIGNTRNDTFARTYSTAMAVWALTEVRQALNTPEYDANIRGGMTWLLVHKQSTWGWWVPNPGRSSQSTGQLDSFPGLTAQVIFILLRTPKQFSYLLAENGFRSVLADFQEWLNGAPVPPSNINLLRRRIGENDRMHDSDRYLAHSKYTIEPSTFLWYPWAVAACRELPDNVLASFAVENLHGCDRLSSRINDLVAFARDEPFSYVTAESLFAVDNRPLTAATKPANEGSGWLSALSGSKHAAEGSP